MSSTVVDQNLALQWVQEHVSVNIHRSAPQSLLMYMIDLVRAQYHFIYLILTS